MAVTLRSVVVFAAIFATALAIPGIWVAEDGSELIGSTALKCKKFSLATYAARRIPSECNSCRCLQKVFVSKKNAHVRFDHTLSSVTVNSVRYEIPGTQNAGGCESNQIKAYVLVCDGAPVTYRLRGFEDYVCKDVLKLCTPASN